MDPAGLSNDQRARIKLKSVNRNTEGKNEEAVGRMERREISLLNEKETAKGKLTVDVRGKCFVVVVLI